MDFTEDFTEDYLSIRKEVKKRILESGIRMNFVAKKLGFAYNTMLKTLGSNDVFFVRPLIIMADEYEVPVPTGLRELNRIKKKKLIVKQKPPTQREIRNKYIYGIVLEDIKLNYPKTTMRNILNRVNWDEKKLSGMERQRMIRILTNMCNAGIISKTGYGRSTFYQEFPKDIYNLL